MRLKKRSLVKRHLKVGSSPIDDEGTLMIRMHLDDLPPNIKWNNYVHFHVKDTRISARIRSNAMAEIPQPRVHQININRTLRESLGIKSGKVYDFYIGKAPFWRGPYYILRYHPDHRKRRIILAKLAVTFVAIAAILGGVLYYVLS